MRGVNTEPDYFNAFRLTSATVKAIGQGMGTLALVQKAINIKEQERQRGRTYNQNWVVFDKDDFPENDFNSAILSARQNGFEVAYSNQAFEFWFLLHFNLYQGLCIVPDMKNVEYFARICLYKEVGRKL